MKNTVGILCASAILSGVFAGFSSASAKDLQISLTNSSDYELGYRTMDGDVSDYPEFIDAGSTGEITFSHGSSVEFKSGKITYQMVNTPYCELSFKIDYELDAFDHCTTETLKPSTNSGSCTLKSSGSATNDDCHYYYTFTTD